MAAARCRLLRGARCCAVQAAAWRTLLRGAGDRAASDDCRESADKLPYEWEVGVRRARASIVWVLMAGAGCTLAASAEAPLTLRSLKQVASLSHQDAARELPADFEATVVYFRSYEKTLFVQDGDAAMYVGATTGQALAPGDRIRVRGTTRDSFRAIVVSSDISLVEHGKLPVPLVASYAQLIHAELDCRYVAVRGRVALAVMSLTSGRNVGALVLRTEGGDVQVTLDSSDAARVRSLLDAEVEISGAASGQFDGKMQQTGVLIHASGFAGVRVLAPAAVDAWSTAATPMDLVLRNANVVDRSERVRVEGTLTYYRPAAMAVLQDGAHSIWVATPQVDRLRLGDRVEAIGMPTVENGFLTMRLGQIRSLGKAVPVKAQPVEWDELASGNHAFDLVSMEGTVVTQVREHAQDVYIIAAGRNLFSATVRHPFVYEWKARRQPPPMPEIRPGSRVRVTGVAMLDDGNPFNGAMAFGILLRSADDVAVIAQAPWLNVQHLVLLAGGLMVVILLVGAWGAVLRRKVHRQAAALALRTEAEAMLQQRRSRVLEDINANRPLTEVLAEIASLVTFNVNGAPCWLQISNGVPVGSCPPSMHNLQVVRHEVRSRLGSLHGTISLAFENGAAQPGNTPEALVMGAGLAALAIDTHRLFADLMHRSEFDLLTDIHNRFSLERHLDAAIDDARLQGVIFGLVYIDLNEFKQVNDRYGHRIGDLCLQQVAERMKRQLRPGDMLARIGGDEFAALVPQVRSRADVEEIAVRLERCFDEPFTLDGYTLRGSASLGIAVYPENGETRDALLSAADRAMYVAKHQHRKMDALLSFGSEKRVERGG